jgi:hypothetical protein
LKKDIFILIKYFPKKNISTVEKGGKIQFGKKHAFKCANEDLQFFHKQFFNRLTLDRN